MTRWATSHRAIAASLWVLTAIAATSCSSSSRPGPDAPPPQGAPTVVVTMRDHSFAYPPNVPAGQVVFRALNEGQTVHRLTMVALTEDIPPIKEQLRGTERRFLSPFAGIPDRPPGRSGTFAVDLVPGNRYAMICFVVDPDGESHAAKGMSAEFRAGQSS